MIKTKIIYFFIIIVTFLFSILYSDYFPLAIFIITLVLPIILNIIIRIIKKSISLDIKSIDVAQNKNDGIEVKILIKNNSIFPAVNGELKLCYYNKFSGNKEIEYINFPINSKETESIDFKVKSKYCGKLIIEIQSLKIYDYLTFSSVKKKVNKSKEIIVLPQIYDLNFSSNVININSLDGEIFSKDKAGDDPSEVFNVREYVEGDKIQRIHWKLSSKVDNVMIKEYSQPIVNDSIIIVEFCENENNINKIQGIIETAISLSHMLLSYNYIHYICWYDRNKDFFNKIIINSEEDMLGVACELLSLKPYTDDVLSLKNYNIEKGSEEYSRKFYVTSNISKKNIMDIKENENMDIFYLDDGSKSNIDGINIKAIDVNNLKNSLENLVV
ncbi:MAG: DUF58 domain-containing protein [Clostridium sp.]|nr:DUF58 domain-containing protein [Clostridium sp.]